MDIQALLNAISTTAMNDRKNYHLTLGGLIKVMEENPSCDAVTKEGFYICQPHSYRGYYSDLSFETSSEKPIDFIKTLKEETLDKTFVGYKGGDFVMAADTPLWIAPYGCTGDAVVDAIVSDGKIILVTKHID